MRLLIVPAAAALVLLLLLSPACQAADLTEPEVISSVDGLLETTISLERATHSQDGFTMTSRLLNGKFPGPTLRIKAGDVLKIRYENNLVDQGLTYRHNRLSAPDETNAHFHGLHISGEIPSDDVAVIHLKPGEAFDYEIGLPSDHMGGTHWMHPHRHGSTTIQVGGGAVMAVIVDNPDDNLPDAVANAREIIMVVHQMDTDDLDDAVSASGDRLLSYSGNPARRFLLTNGQINPTIRVDVNEWVRLRVVFSGWVSRSLDMNIPGCDMQLLAKDGIYIRDFPRSITTAPVPPGGRVDVMVRCSLPSRSFPIRGWRGNTVATITTSSIVNPRTTLPSWTPTFPSYIADLRGSTVTPGCRCSTNVGDNDGMNSRAFTEGEAIHSSPLGAIVERVVDADDHPYHQHVYPYQLISVSETAYDKVGDWHDTIHGTAVVRHQVTRFAGKVMLHW